MNQAPLPLDGAHILVVEDEFLLLIELAAILQDAGAERVESCRSIEQALALTENTDGLDAAILDIRIGKCSIAPVARRLVDRGVPLVYYTGQVGNDPVMSDLPPCRVLSKPAHPAAIVSAMAGLLKR